GPVPDWSVSHLWSLSVEEQFYIVWPFLLSLLSKKMCRVVAAGFIVVSTVLHFHLLVQAPVDLWRREYEFQYSGAAIAFGCLLAIDGKWIYERPSFQKICASPLSTPAVCIALLAARMLFGARSPGGVCATDVTGHLCIAFFIAKFTSRPV